MIAREERPATPPDLLRIRAEQTPEGVATFHRDQAGAWIPTTWSALWIEVRRTAAALQSLGLRPGDRIAIIARTCREWQLAELGAVMTGATVVGIDAHAAPEQIVWILEQADVSALVVDTTENASKAPADVQNRLKFVVVFDEEPAPSASRRHSWCDMLARHSSSPAPIQIPNPDAVAMLIYTSGTTGTPKGIEYTNRQLMTSCWSMIDEFPDLGESNRVLCWLPMAPLFQRMLNLVAFASLSATYFVENPRDIMSRIAEVRPTIFTSVPRFYEKLHDGIQERLAGQTGVRKRLIDAALAAGLERSQCLRSGVEPTLLLRIRHALLDRLVLRKLRGVMGGDIKWMISGSAAAPVWLLEFFHSIGLLVLEAYGITENPVPIAANRSSAYRFGSVGRPFVLNQVRLSDDSEVLVKGPAMFRRYRSEGTPLERFTSDGYYRTGDYGRLDQDGFLYLTGRIAEMIKTSTGRRISPVAIEAVYCRSRYVEHVVVVGNDRPWLAALVTLNIPAVRAMLGHHLADEDLAASPAAFDLINQEFARLGNALSPHEQVRAFGILPAALTIENGELTSNLKLRRDGIESKYQSLIQTIYRSDNRQDTASAELLTRDLSPNSTREAHTW